MAGVVRGKGELSGLRCAGSVEEQPLDAHVVVEVPEMAQVRDRGQHRAVLVGRAVARHVELGRRGDGGDTQQLGDAPAAS